MRLLLFLFFLETSAYICLHRNPGFYLVSQFNLSLVLISLILLGNN